MFKPAGIYVEQIPVSASLSGMHRGSKRELLIQPTSTPPNGCELSVPLRLSLAGAFYHSLNISLCSCLVSYPNYYFMKILSHLILDCTLPEFISLSIKLFALISTCRVHVGCLGAD